MTLIVDAYEYLLIRMRLERKGNEKLEPTPCDRRGPYNEQETIVR